MRQFYPLLIGRYKFKTPSLSKLFWNDVRLWKKFETYSKMKFCFQAVTQVTTLPLHFLDVTPCSLLRCNLRFGGTYRLNHQGRIKYQQEPAGGKQNNLRAGKLGFLLKFSSNLKMEAICSSETSVESQQTTRRHIPEEDTLHNHRCENLKSYITNTCSSETSVDFQRTTWCYIPEDRTLQNKQIIAVYVIITWNEYTLWSKYKVLRLKWYL
jgi:hypothetical protein